MKTILAAMTKRRLLRWSLLLVILAAFAVWLEPTRVVWGWLRGAAFYQGRPTSYWAGRIAEWAPAEPFVQDFQGTSLTARVPYGWNIGDFRRRLHNYTTMFDPVWPSVLNGDEKANTVLRELLADQELIVREWAHVGLARLASGDTGPCIDLTFREIKEYVDEKTKAHRYKTIDGRRQCVRVPGMDVCVDELSGASGW